MLVFTAVLPLRNTSNEMPSRGEMSFQFCTRPVQLFGRLFSPSGQAPYVWAGLSVVAGIGPRGGELAGALVVDRLDRNRAGGHFRLILFNVLLVVDAEARVEQHPVRLRPRPLRDRDEAGRRRLNRRRLGRDVPGDA